tara:strand:- start:6924 stop:7580 length:657 start_codon:yes stop_codon:yes gene_type:complete
MAFLCANVPHIEVLVKKQYLYDLEKGHGEYVPGVWCTVKSIQGRALYFETYLYESGALYDKLPISAFCWKETKEDISLPELQLWDCFDYDIAVIEKQVISGNRCSYLSPKKKIFTGNYMFSVDSCNSTNKELNVGYSEVPSQHKSFNILKLDNGHFAAQPNNRVLFYDKSLSPSELTKPDYKTSTKDFSVDSQAKWTAGDSDKFAYELDTWKDEIKYD